MSHFKHLKTRYTETKCTEIEQMKIGLKGLDWEG
jgi:hypothetical protein